MSLIGEFKHWPTVGLWLLDHGSFLSVSLATTTCHQQESRCAASHQVLATQGRRPHWAKTIRTLSTLEHIGSTGKKLGAWVLLWVLWVWTAGGSHILWLKTMISLFTEPEPPEPLLHAGTSSHNRALNSLFLKPELHGDALMKPFTVCPRLFKIAAGALPLLTLKHCHLVVAVALLEKWQRQLSWAPETLDRVLDLQAFLVLRCPLLCNASCDFSSWGAYNSMIIFGQSPGWGWTQTQRIRMTVLQARESTCDPLPGSAMCQALDFRYVISYPMLSVIHLKMEGIDWPFISRGNLCISEITNVSIYCKQSCGGK